MSTKLTPFLYHLNTALNNVENWTIVRWNPEGGFDIIDWTAFEACLLERAELATSEAVFRAQLSRHGIRRLSPTLYRQCDNLIQRGRKDLLYKLTEQVRDTGKIASRMRATSHKRPTPTEPIKREEPVKRALCTNEGCVRLANDLELSQKIVASQEKRLKDLEAQLEILKSQVDISSQEEEPSSE